MSFCFSYCLSVLFLDVLLCHDDELEGRRVAFILYLVPPWQSSDGGTLNLYTTDSECPTVFACVRARVCILLHNRSVYFIFVVRLFAATEHSEVTRTLLEHTRAL